MAAIVLPSSPAPSGAVISYVDWGGVLRPALGGAAQRINRLGTRHRLEVTMPPMTIDDARVWVQRLKRGVHEGVYMKFPQPGFEIGTESDPRVQGAGTIGKTVSLKENVAGYAFREGQWFNHVSLPSGQNYLYSIDAPAVANGSGIASIVITPLPRVTFQNDDPIRIVQPFIEGSLTGDEQSWTVNSAHHYGLAFGIEEDA